jgi:hypothetical protein
MRPEPPRDPDAEQEVELGRYWSAIVARWWLPILGIVAAAIIGILVQVGSSQTWTATTEVYLGQPLGANGSAAVTPASTSLGLVSNFVTSERTIKDAAARAGLRPGRLRGHITTKPILGVTGTKVGTTAPLLDITVDGTPGGKIAAAANALGDAVVTYVSSYSASKLQALKDELAYDTSQLAVLTARLDAARANLQQILKNKSIGATDRLVALAGLSTVISNASQQQNLLEQDRFTARQDLAQAQYIEQGHVVAQAVATRVAAPSKRAGAAIGAFIGLILGLLAALFWDPVTRRLKAHPAGH